MRDFVIQSACFVIQNAVTCRMAALESSRRLLGVQQTLVQEQTHLLYTLLFQFWFENRSLVHCHCLCCHCIVHSSSNPFHLETTRYEKKHFLISLLHLYFTNFKECPWVLPDVSSWNIAVNGKEEKRWAILKTSIKSARFLHSSNVQSPPSAVGVIFRLQGRKIGPTVHYFPSVWMENNMHTYAILRPYGRKINATICHFPSAETENSMWLHPRYFPFVVPSSEYRYMK